MIDAQQLRDRTHRFSLDIIRFCESLSSDIRTQRIATQLHDAATSVAMNYRAAWRARRHAEFVAKICITVEEVDEALGWLETLMRSRKTGGPEADRLFRECTELVKIFAASKRTAMANERQPKPRRTRR